MANIVVSSDLCRESLHNFSAPRPLFDGDEYEWRIVEQPFGANGVLNTVNSPDAVLDTPVAGCYTIGLSITRTEGEDLPSSGRPPVLLGCPQGVLAGDNVDVYFECNFGTLDSVVLSGPNTGYTVAGDYISITTDNTTVNGGAIGDLVITVTCIDEFGVTEVQTCTTKILPTDSTIEWQSSTPICMEAIECKTVCLNCETTICVSNCEPLCDEGILSGTTKDCPEIVAPVNKNKPVPLTQQFLVGAQNITVGVGEIFDNCDVCEDGRLSCFEHKPSFCWNNVCNCPGWTVEGNGLFNTSPADACCGSGRSWIFEGTGAMEANGPDTPNVSCAIIWGHNIAQGTVTTFPPIDPEGSSNIINLTSDNACLGGYTQPIVLNLIAQDTNVTSIEISGTTVDGGPIRINQLFMGDKLFLEDDNLPDGFINPHNGSDFIVEVKENDCGYPISREVIRQKKVMELNLECLSERWLKETLRSYIRYLGAGNPVYFQWSRNGCPADIFMGDLTQVIEGSEYDQIFQSITLRFEGYCQQPQAKRLV